VSGFEVKHSNPDGLFKEVHGQRLVCYYADVTWAGIFVNVMRGKEGARKASLPFLLPE